MWHGRPVRIAAVGGDKITVSESGDRSCSVRPRDVEILHSGPWEGGTPETLPPPDWDEILELTAGEELSFRDWTELCWGEWSCASAWSGFQALRDGVYWEGSVSGTVKSRPPEAIAASLSRRAAKNAKAAALEALLERLRSNAPEPGDEVPMREVFAVARGERERSAIMEALGLECTPRQAHRLLLRTGLADDTFDPWPARYGVGYPGEAGPGEEASAEPPVFSGEAEEMEFPDAAAIDAAESGDPDDGISPAADGSLWVHVADPCGVIADGSEIDREAMARGTTLYLPEGAVTMLPERFTDICALGLQERSRALSLHIGFDADGAPRLLEFKLTALRVHRITYEAAEARLKDAPEWRGTLISLERFGKFREAAGGVDLTLPEADVRVLPSGEVKLCPVTDNFGRRIVRQAMVAAGAAAGRWAAENDVPMPFVTQHLTEDAPDFGAFDGSWTASFLRRCCFQPSSVSTSGGLHSALGVENYVRVTSPLRRYADMLAHRQLRAALSGEAYLSADEIERRLCRSEEGARNRRCAERDAENFWKTVFMKRLGRWQGRAVKLGEIHDKSVFILPEPGLEVKTRWGVGTAAAGSEWIAELCEADIVEGECRFRFLPTAGTAPSDQ